MKVGISALTAYESCENFLKSLLGCSHQAIKRHLTPQEKKRKIASQQAGSYPIDLINGRQINPEFTSTRIPKILYDDANFLVLNKPANVHSHPLLYQDTENCLSYLRSIGQGRLLLVNQNQHERGLLYRLDYETSGVLIYCKHEDLYQELRLNFELQVKEKIYVCIVKGQLRQQGAIEHFLSPSEKKGAKMRALSPHESKQAGELKAIIEVSSLKYFARQDLTLVKVKLHHGHRHQIRVQLAAQGHGIWGDPLYGEKRADEGPRLFLHAYAYTLNFEKLLTPLCFYSREWEGYASLLEIQNTELSRLIEPIEL